MPEPLSAAHLAFGRAVRERREAAGLSMDEFVRRSSLSRSFLFEVEGGRGNLSLAGIIAISQALGVAPSELVRAVDSAVRLDSAS